MANILEQIIQDKEKELEVRKKEQPLGGIKSRLPEEACRSLSASLRQTGGGVIAEVKHASPSRGLLVQDFDPVRIAKAYEQGGARGISVLTEEKYFQGSLNDLKAVRDAVRLPVLRKDFLFDDYQIYESRLWGADALLLITKCLSDDQLISLLMRTHELGMEALVEVHNEQEYMKAKMAGAKIIGVNNRNLDDFNVDLDVSSRIADLAGKDMMLVSESGITSRQDLLRLRDSGITSFLIGEFLVTQKDISKSLRELTA